MSALSPDDHVAKSAPLRAAAEGEVIRVFVVREPVTDAQAGRLVRDLLAIEGLTVVVLQDENRRIVNRMHVTGGSSSLVQR